MSSTFEPAAGHRARRRGRQNGLRNRSLGPRAKAVMDAAPGCVLMTVIAPDFATGRPADLLALLLTAVAASRLSLLPTVLISIASAALLRGVLA
jgi:uncharacterized membrane protein